MSSRLTSSCFTLSIELLLSLNVLIVPHDTSFQENAKLVLVLSASKSVTDSGGSRPVMEIIILVAF